MKQASDRLRFRGMVQARSDVSARLKRPGDAVLVERNRPRLLVMSCPCGCGDELPINLDRLAGPAWIMYRETRGLSLYPSVWRETGCQSHFIVWRNKILLFGRYESDFERTTLRHDDSALVDAVRERLPYSGLISFAEIARDIGAVPWDVLMICRRLVRAGAAWEGTEEHRASFGRIGAA